MTTVVPLKNPPMLPFKHNSHVSRPKPTPPFEQGTWLSSAPSDVYREDDIWRQTALRLMWQERYVTNPTPLIHLKSPGLPNVNFVFKDEGFTPTNTAAYRSIWKLVFWSLLQDVIHHDSHIVDASFGNGAVAEAYFFNLLGLNFTVVVPENLDPVRQSLLKAYRANVVLARPSQLLLKAGAIAADDGAVFINQYLNDFFVPTNNINPMAELIADNLPLPDYFVIAAGTGSTITSVGHFVKKYNLPTQIVLADTEFSSYFDYVVYGKFTNDSSESLWVEPGLDELGFGRFESVQISEASSLEAGLVDRALKVPDLASVAAMHFLRTINIDAGPATGLSFVAALSIAAKEREYRLAGQTLQIALLITNPGSFHNATYYNETWINLEMSNLGGFETVQCWLDVINQCFQTDNDPLKIGAGKCLSPTQELLRSA